MEPSLACLLVESAARAPQKTAVRFLGTSTTFAELDSRSNRLANGFRAKGVGPGDRVALYCINSTWFVVSYFAILKAGATVVPVNLLLHPEEVAFVLNDAEARLVVYHEVTDPAIVAIRTKLTHTREYVAIGRTTVPGAEPYERLVSENTDGAVLVPPANAAEDVAVILYTGGTTGLPKGVMLTHDNLLSNVRSVVSALTLDRHPDDVFITVLPMFHAFGATAGFLAPVAAGSTFVALPQFAADATCRTIQAERATVFLGVPTMYAMMANLAAEHTYDLGSLRCCVSGGAAMPPAVMERFERRYGVPIYEGDGPTECSPVTCVNPIGGPRKPLSVGVPIPGVEMKILDEHGAELPVGELGEVCVRGRSVMKGYWKQPEETRNVFHAGGWLRTGDVGRMDDEGYFYLVDRRKDMIIVHGINVYPRQVEDVLYRHPAIAEAAVIGIPDDLHGEMPKAFVALKPGEDVHPHELIRYCREHLGRFEVPRRVEILSALPKSGAGKILKRTLRDLETKKRAEGPPAGEDDT
jgi:long-chain acyl-CoA synthetase